MKVGHSTAFVGIGFVAGCIAVAGFAAFAQTKPAQYKVVHVGGYGASSPGFEELLNKSAAEGYRLHSVGQQAAIFERK